MKKKIVVKLSPSDLAHRNTDFDKTHLWLLHKPKSNNPPPPPPPPEHWFKQMDKKTIVILH